MSCLLYGGGNHVSTNAKIGWGLAVVVVIGVLWYALSKKPAPVVKKSHIPDIVQMVRAA